MAKRQRARIESLYYEEKDSQEIRAPVDVNAAVAIEVDLGDELSPALVGAVDLSKYRSKVPTSIISNPLQSPQARQPSLFRSSNVPTVPNDTLQPSMS